MKIKLLLSCFVMIFAMTSSYASFPVKRAKATPVLLTENVTTTTTTTVSEAPLVSYAAAAKGGARDKWVGVALWFFLGWPFAAHRWYYGKPVLYNILFIITIGGLGIWAIIDLINILTDNF